MSEPGLRYGLKGIKIGAEGMEFKRSKSLPSREGKRSGHFLQRIITPMESMDQHHGDVTEDENEERPGQRPVQQIGRLNHPADLGSPRSEQRNTEGRETFTLTVAAQQTERGNDNHQDIEHQVTGK